MPYAEARNLKDDKGQLLIQHPVACVDCHDAKTMVLRITRPAFLAGIKALKAKQGIADFDPNRDATRQEMRSYVCGQCHVEYYFKGPGKVVTSPGRTASGSRRSRRTTTKRASPIGSTPRPAPRF
jgi:nitrite reductase (cytochrome c-552)